MENLLVPDDQKGFSSPAYYIRMYKINQIPNKYTYPATNPVHNIDPLIRFMTISQTASF